MLHRVDRCRSFQIVVAGKQITWDLLCHQQFHEILGQLDFLGQTITRQIDSAISPVEV